MAQRTESGQETRSRPLTKQDLQQAYVEGLSEGWGSVFLPGTPLPCGLGKEKPRGRVLLMDGDPHVLDGVGCFLTAWGLSVRCEATAVRGLKVLSEKMQDLLLLGHQLQDREGLEVLGEVRATIPKLPVLMIGTATSDVRETLRKGAQGVLIRPLSAEDLKAQVFQALGKAKSYKAPVEKGRTYQAS